MPRKRYFSVSCVEFALNPKCFAHIKIGKAFRWATRLYAWLKKNPNVAAKH